MIETAPPPPTLQTPQVLIDWMMLLVLLRNIEVMDSVATQVIQVHPGLRHISPYKKASTDQTHNV